MAESLVLEAEVREQTGKSSARALRRDGKVPAIIYGGKNKEVSVALSEKELTTAYNKGGFKSHVLELKAGKESFQVLPRDIQLHPLTSAPLHADFLRVSKDEKVGVWVKVKFRNDDKSPGLKRGGILNVVRHEVELECPVTDIPSSIEVDLTGCNIGDSLHISSVSLPEGVTPIIKDRDFTLATIAGRAAKEEEETGAPVAATLEGAEAEGEVGAEETSVEGKPEASKE